MLSNFPDGTTDADIDERFGDGDEDDYLCDDGGYCFDCDDCGEPIPPGEELFYLDEFDRHICVICKNCKGGEKTVLDSQKHCTHITAL